MMKKTLISVILLLAIVFLTHAQQHCFFTHYSTEDGLSQNTVMNILQDHKDNLWFATWDGINRFNGYTFKTYKARRWYCDCRLPQAVLVSSSKPTRPL